MAIPQYLEDDIIDWAKKGATAREIMYKYLSSGDHQDIKEEGVTKKQTMAFIRKVCRQSKKSLSAEQRARGRKTHPTTGETVWFGSGKTGKGIWR